MSDRPMLSSLRNVGLFGSIILLVVGVAMAWSESKHPTELAQTGGPAGAPGKMDALIRALTSWISGKSGQA